jgi:hypothetical protein
MFKESHVPLLERFHEENPDAANANDTATEKEK